MDTANAAGGAPRQSDNVDSAQELTNLVTQMLEQMQTRFGQMNGNIVSRIDEMSKKIDELEGSIGELVKEAQEEPEADQRAGEGQ